MPIREPRKGREKQQTNFSLFEYEINRFNILRGTNSVGPNKLKLFKKVFAVRQKISDPKLMFIGETTTGNKTTYWYVDRRTTKGTIKDRKN